VRNTRLCVRLPFGFGDKSTGRAATGQGQDEFRQKNSTQRGAVFYCRKPCRIASGPVRYHSCRKPKTAGRLNRDIVLIFFKHLIMRLITKEIEKKFQKHPFRSQDKKGIDATVLVKYFTPWGAATWLITEAEQQPDGDWMLYGYCTLGYEWEWGTLMLSELQALRGPFGLTTERDLYIGNNATVAELAY